MAVRIAVLVVAQVAAGVAGYDWDGVRIPAAAGSGRWWKLDPDNSDDFNYNGKPGNRFGRKWRDSYINKWSGPGLTRWSKRHTEVWGGNLIVKAQRKAGTKFVHTGIVTSKTPVRYPLYTEASIRVANQVLSSNFWFLSEDQTRELDVLEMYGGDKDQWYATGASNNYHFFKRNPKTNAIISDFHKPRGGFTVPNKNEPVFYRAGFHRFGMHWMSPWAVDFYIDGVPVRRLRYRANPSKGYERMENPHNPRRGMDQKMVLVLDMQDHVHRSNKGIVATDAELAKGEHMYVNWVRTYTLAGPGR